MTQELPSSEAPSVGYNHSNPSSHKVSDEESSRSSMISSQSKPISLQADEAETQQVNPVDKPKQCTAEAKDEKAKSDGGKGFTVLHNTEDTISDNEDLVDLDSASLRKRVNFIATDISPRRSRATQRLLQSQAYMGLVEERIRDLEEEVRKLAHKPREKKGERSDEIEIPGIIGIVAMGWNDFSPRIEVDSKELRGKWEHRMELDQKGKHVIEILTEVPHFTPLEVSQGTVSTTMRPPALKNDSPSTIESATMIRPYAIRIRSRLLLKVLKETTGCDTTLGPFGHRLLLLYPFKLLVFFQEEIKNKLQDLRVIHNKACEDVHLEHDAPWEIDSKSPGKVSERASNFPIKETESSEALEQLQLLCKMMDDYLGQQLELQRTLNPGVSKIAFNDLWYIFKPGLTVRTPGDSQIQLYRVIKVTGGRKSRPGRNIPDLHASQKLKEEGYSEGSFIIECFYVHFDGNRFGPVNATFQIRRFEGERTIKSLPIVPLICYKDEDGIRKRLGERGEKFFKLSNSQATAHRKYKGLTLDKNQEQVDSEVIIDFELAFIQKSDSKPILGLEGRLVTDDSEGEHFTAHASAACHEEGCCGNDITFPDYQVDERERRKFDYGAIFDSIADDARHLEAEHKILLPPQVYGFVLRTRRWATFDIDLLEDPNYGDGWEHLVIDDHIKNTVLALVKNHERDVDSHERIDGAMASVDLVQGKGRGLILLLHGEPGVGKTSTAECVAAQTKRPLFPITCGDIGDRAETVETNLEKSFQLAHKWGCVLLLDEADIFLTERSNEDIQRNSIVSVFLRTLEYYSGILFLTTNRVGKIDRAFKSRIHLSLLYKKLDKERTVQIWENNISRVNTERTSDNRRIDCRRTDIIEFVKKHYDELDKSDDLVVWNGRQIRNAFQTAIAIAAYEQAPRAGRSDGDVVSLSSAQFEQVAKNAKEFDKYLKSVHSINESGFAKTHTNRDDDFVNEKDVPKRDKKKKKKNKSREESYSESSHSDSDRKHRKKRKKNNS